MPARGTGIQLDKGGRYWRLTVTDQDGNQVECTCDCGKIVRAPATLITAGRVKSCGCLAHDLAKERFGQLNRLKCGDSVRNQIYRKYKFDRRGFEFALTVDEFQNLVSQPCAYCGALPALKTRKMSFGGFACHGIDRVDNAKGYLKDNCVPCCAWCNRAKKELSVADFLLWASSVRKRLSPVPVNVNPHWGKCHLNGLTWFGRGAFNVLIKGYAAKARIRGLVFTLSQDQFYALVVSTCAYCGAIPSRMDRLPRRFGYFQHGGIDRIDNAKGYVLGNVVPCCGQCNTAKSDLTADEFYRRCAAVAARGSLRTSAAWYPKP